MFRFLLYILNLNVETGTKNNTVVYDFYFQPVD